MIKKIANHKGFTLVELMIVVAIIGILAAIAIPNFLNFRLKAKASEAKSNLGAIRSTEVAYFAEWSVWVGNQPFTPTGNRSGNSVKVAWDATTRFSILGFAPEGQVFFDYNLEGADYPTNAGFTSMAAGDLDADTVINYYWITSNDTELRHSGGMF